MTLKTLEHLPPIHHLLGGHNIQWNADQTELEISYVALDSFTNPRGSVEGGMVCAMLDDVMGLFAYLANNQTPATTINLTMDFLRPCLVGTVLTKCRFIKQGKVILNIESEAWQNQKLIARSTANFMVLNP
ncbi:PaaI family thioesterase [Acinetobacter sp. ANC 4173]|uniref:PaaI family thioesterase n=1 Tax=Acinetobacter sp. ANC 4173 TaxID=2529837 RepID=UPI00103D1F96|nr:PaaI family thioesterase [Acinetobacter sp. ANC 4173]TCB79113.1 PaaI family thioesterase [Acinetobacter sp. ANC 4173]